MESRQAVKQVQEILKNFENPLLEAEWLVALALNKKRAEVYNGYALTKSQERRVFACAKKRSRGIPLEYIFSSANFYGYELKVNKHTLIPRPETEELAELVIKNAKPDDTILDIGTGSGAIAIAVQKQTGAKVVAVDISKSALKVAKQNAKSNGAEIEFLASDIFSRLKNRRFDIIISNPPYVSEEEYVKLDKNVKDYEPKLALVGKDGGLEFYKKIISKAPGFLKKNGKLFFEIGYLQGEAVKNLLLKDFEDIEIRKDLEGQDRMVSARLKGVYDV